MCAKCVDAVYRTFPDVPESETGDFLMSCTAFPLADPETVERQLIELRARTDDYRACYLVVEEDMAAAMAAIDPEEPC